jgi:hypothetical protein
MPLRSPKHSATARFACLKLSAMARFARQKVSATARFARQNCLLGLASLAKNCLLRGSLRSPDFFSAVKLSLLTSQFCTYVSENKFFFGREK